MIRQFEQSDINQLAEFIMTQSKEIGGDGFADANIERIVSFIKGWSMSADCIIFVDEKDRIIRGYAMAQLDSIPWSGKPICQMNVFYVAPEHRNGHIANNLFDSVEYWAKQNDCCHMINSVLMYDKDCLPQHDFIENAHSFFSRKMTECGVSYVKEIL